jgi:hypothetical protein
MAGKKRITNLPFGMHNIESHLTIHGEQRELTNDLLSGYF